MAGVSGWFSTPYECAEDPSQSHGVGWYLDGQLISTDPNYYNNGGGGGGGTPTGTTTQPQDVRPEGGGPAPEPKPPGIWYEGEFIGEADEAFYNLDQEAQEAWIKETYGIDVAGGMWGLSGASLPAGAPGAPGAPVTPAAVPLPSFGDVNVPAPAVTPAPPYEPSEAQLAWQEQFGGKLEDWMEAGGYGIPEETQALMTQQLTDTLKAKETEDIRVMRNNMERRGITNSGFVFSNEQKIRSGTTMALAKSITDIKIQSALMKMASFEKAMGATALFLGYLSEQSQLQYQPQYQTWAAQQQANLYQFQAKMDLYKINLTQAYHQQNLILQNQLTQSLQDDQQAWDTWALETELEAQKAAAQAQGAGQLFGASIGAAATIAAG